MRIQCRSKYKKTISYESFKEKNEVLSLDRNIGELFPITNIINYYVNGHLSWTKTAMSQPAKDSLLTNSFRTPSSGISLNIRNFLFPCIKKLEI